MSCFIKQELSSLSNSKATKRKRALMRVLVTGGAGYIGSVVIETLLSAGAECVVALDNLSKGHRSAVLPPAVFYQGDISDKVLVEKLCRDHQINAVIHMAALALVRESMQDPSSYYQNNVVKGLALLDALRAAGVMKLVFSCTAAVYREPSSTPITEDFPTLPTNPYGESKLAFERVLKWYHRAYGLRFVSLRYFNAAGATEKNGEQHEPETHLIPLALDVAQGKRAQLQILGGDYPTPDGTCIRDYIHVSDLARAHVLALSALEQFESRIYNLGNGDGFSVKEVVSAACTVTGRAIPFTIESRGVGDPATLVASAEKITRELGWRPEKPNIEQIISDAWSWRLWHPSGYPRE
jgi:UDP-glucose 4-epimerase